MIWQWSILCAYSYNNFGKCSITQSHEVFAFIDAMNEIKDEKKNNNQRVKKQGNILSAKFLTGILLEFYRATFALFTVFVCVSII